MVEKVGLGNTLGICLLVSMALWLIGVPFMFAMLPFIIAAVLLLLPFVMLYIYEKWGE